MNKKKNRLTWPLKEDELKELNVLINEDLISTECEIKFVEVPCKSKNIKIYRLALRKNDKAQFNFFINGEYSLYANISRILDFLIVNVETKDIFIHAETESIGDLMRNNLCFCDSYDLCSVSYSALAKMLNPSLPKNEAIEASVILDTFTSCDFSIEDAIADTTLSLPSSNPMVKMLKAMKEEDVKKGLKKDYSQYRIDGYTLESTSQNNRLWRFHKPSSVLVKAISNKKTTYFVMGVDEGTYFGCVLPPKSNPKTIDEGFRLLIPVAFRGLKDDEYLRQGEWFSIDMGIMLNHQMIAQTHISTILYGVELLIFQRKAMILMIIV